MPDSFPDLNSNVVNPEILSILSQKNEAKKTKPDLLSELKSDDISIDIAIEAIPRHESELNNIKAQLLELHSSIKFSFP